MGSVKQHQLEQAGKNYERNRYNNERRKLIERIRLYADNPGFVAQLKNELAALERNWKSRKR